MTSNRDDRGRSVLGGEWGQSIVNREAKEVIARRVAGMASSGDVIGVGSGSTSFLTVLALGARVERERLSLRVVPTSIEIELACQAVGLELCGSIPTRIDWCFDGADEVDPAGRLIKGRGGAIYRERLVFAAASRRIVIADASKTVARLGEKFPVPVEVEPAWVRVAYARLREMTNVTEAVLRMGVAKDGPVITETGRLIFDVRMKQIAESDEAGLLRIPGVCCTGIFSGFEFTRIEG